MRPVPDREFAPETRARRGSRRICHRERGRSDPGASDTLATTIVISRLETNRTTPSSPFKGTTISSKLRVTAITATLPRSRRITVAPGSGAARLLAGSSHAHACLETIDRAERDRLAVQRLAPASGPGRRSPR